MSLESAFAPAEAAYKAQVIAATWGHLAPKSRKLYTLSFTFTCAGYGGSIQLIDSKLPKGLADSPWLYDHMYSYVMKRARQRMVHTFTGTMYQTKSGRAVFKGTVKRLALR